MGNVVPSTYTTGTRALPDIYARALGLVRVYQAKHSSLWYKYNIYICLVICPIQPAIVMNKPSRQILLNLLMHVLAVNN